jgi:hypothetical protein
MRYQAICGGCNAVYQKTRQPKAILNKVADAKRALVGWRHLAFCDLIAQR